MKRYNRLFFLGLLVVSSTSFALTCPTVNQVTNDFAKLKIHQYVNIRHDGVTWEAMRDHNAKTLGMYFDYVHINTDAPKHDGVSCFYSSNHGNDISIVYRVSGEFISASKNWKETVDESGPMCGDYHETIKDATLCKFKKK